MTRYRVLRDFGSHLGNHTRGQVLDLPEGALPRGFAGLVEPVNEPVPAASEPAPAEGAALSPADAAPDPPVPDPPSSPADQARAGYSDKMITSARSRRRGR